MVRHLSASQKPWVPHLPHSEDPWLDGAGEGCNVLCCLKKFIIIQHLFAEGSFLHLPLGHAQLIFDLKGEGIG